jgi:thiol:disulfide interchange protein DsbD
MGFVMIFSGNISDYFLVFGAGVAVSFTPCVYPLLPVTAAIIAGANTRGTKFNAFLLSLLYVLGLAVSYCLLGVVAAFTGKVFGAWQNHPVVFLVLGNIFLFFAFVLFDVLPLPVLTVGVGRGKKRSRASLFLAGAASGFIVSPCTAPVLGALLLRIGLKQDLFYGISLLFVFAFGAGASLILAGTFSGFLASLPKAGHWTGVIRKLAGIVMIAAAELMFLRAGGLF